MRPGLANPAAPSISRVLKGFPSPARGRPRDPGLFGPGSMVWRVNGETATLLGGGRALLMQVAHPLVAAGVADHSDFQEHAYDRLWRTLDAVLTVAFGDTDQAAAAADRVTDVHRGVTGVRDGRRYAALDPDLLVWVHATLVDTALLTYGRFVRPLAPAQAERYYEEMKRFAAAFRVPPEALPPDLGAFRRYVEETMAGLEVGAEARSLARGILSPPAPAALLPVRGLLKEVTVGLLPDRLRAGFRLAWGPARQVALDLAGATLRRTIPALPAKVRRWPHARAAQARMASDQRE